MSRIVLLGVCLVLSGCAALWYPGVSRDELSRVKVGAMRAEIEELFGEPRFTQKLDGKKTQCNYDVEVEIDAGERAQAFTADALHMFGMSLFCSTVIDGHCRDALVKKYEFILLYDENNRVESVEQN